MLLLACGIKQQLLQILTQAPLTELQIKLAPLTDLIRAPEELLQIQLITAQALLLQLNAQLTRTVSGKMLLLLLLLSQQKKHTADL